MSIDRVIKLSPNTPSIPEERLKTSPHILSAPLKTGKENNPLIDPKYLSKPNQKSNPQRPALQTQNKQTIPSNPSSSHVPPVIPLMSAYFPTNPPMEKNGSSLL